MTKRLLILGDLHIGVRKDDPKIEKIIVDAFEQAIKYSKKHKINTWIQTGDWFDVRSAITHTTMELISKTLVPMIRKAKIHIHVLVGNHDMKHKNSITPNACDEVLSQYDDVITVYQEPTTIDFDGVDIDMIPWVCDENIETILAFIKNSGSKYCVGHWELNGYFFYKNQPSTGYDPGFLEKYDQVFSGHFHTISKGGNVLYVGTPYTLTYGDENDERGFWDFEPSTGKFTFVQNKTMWHQRIEYPVPEKFDPKSIHDCCVRVIIEDEDDDFQKFVDEVLVNTHDYRLVRSNKLLSSMYGFDPTEDVTLNEDGSTKSILDISNEYVDGMNLTDDEKVNVKSILQSLYNKVRG